jgi:hypothetical protein
MNQNKYQSASTDDSEGKGVLYTEAKKKHEKAPDFRGNIVINGVVVRLAGWRHKTKYGDLVSLKVDNYKAPDAPKQQYPVDTAKFDDDIPF